MRLLSSDSPTYVQPQRGSMMCLNFEKPPISASKIRVRTGPTISAVPEGTVRVPPAVGAGADQAIAAVVAGRFLAAGGAEGRDAVAPPAEAAAAASETFSQGKARSGSVSVGSGSPAVARVGASAAVAGKPTELSRLR